MSNLKRRKEIFDAIRDILLDHASEENRLNYSALYDKVNNKLRSRGKGISHRDFDSEVRLSVQEKRLTRREDTEAKSKVKPVYLSLTQKALKHYQQHDLLGIDEVKDRRRKLFQLLFFYEVCKGSSCYIKGDKDFDKFLKSISFSAKDLEISKQSSMDDGQTITDFHPIQEIQITKYQEPQEEVKGDGKILRHRKGSKETTNYIVRLPGFTVQDIVRYTEQDALEPPGSWFYPYYPAIFTHIRFTPDEIKEVLGLLEKARLIQLLPIARDNHLNVELPAELRGRYIIADTRLRKLIQVVWELYLDRLSILKTKYRLEDFEDKDKAWLTYIFGEQETERILQEWQKETKSLGIIRVGQKETIEIKDGRLKKTESGYNRVRESEFNIIVDGLMEKYKSVLEEYDLPLSYIRTMLSIS